MALEIRENEPLKNYSTFKIGGLARYFVVIKTKEKLIEAIDFAKEKNLPYFVFGGGSNILFRDKGFDGVVIKIGNWKLEIGNFSVVAGAGVLFSQLIMKSIEEGLSGLEWGVGIPGTIAGCVAGNCGAFGKSISDLVKKVRTLDKEYTKEECRFAYRDSRFKPPIGGSSAGGKEIILEIELELKKRDKDKSKEEIKSILADRKGKIPPYPSIGCIFKNPKPLKARSLIEQCGLKGKRIGNAQISDIHANFIVNLGNASSEDVLNLVEICKKEVKNKFNINLDQEIVVLQ